MPEQLSGSMAKAGPGRAGQGYSASGAPPLAGAAPHAIGGSVDGPLAAGGPTAVFALRPSHHRAPSGDPQPKGPTSSTQPRSQPGSQATAPSRRASGGAPSAPAQAVSAAAAAPTQALAGVPAADAPAQGDAGSASTARQTQQQREPKASQEEIEAALRCLLLGTIQVCNRLGRGQRPWFPGTAVLLALSRYPAKLQGSPALCFNVCGAVPE